MVFSRLLSTISESSMGSRWDIMVMVCLPASRYRERGVVT